MKLKGLLIPVYALPSKYGIGSFSKEALHLIDILSENGFNAWQILPLNPVGYGNSPYQALSSYALEEAYISLDDLYARKLINKPIPFIENSNFVKYKEVLELKKTYYLEAFLKYLSNHSKEELDKFGKDNPKLYEYSKYVSLKEINDSKVWNKWEKFNDKKLESLICYHLFLQMILFQEWNDIKTYANEKGIKIIGDIPYYVGFDSSDVYFNQNYFLLENQEPTFVSGVGPDYFSKEGQLWGNPIYFYGAMYDSRYSFLVDRIIAAANLYDMVRIDHFRAFDTYYIIKANEKTAVNGEWWSCPGYEILDALFERKRDIKLIAEDLGLLRNEVYTLRDHYNLPGMDVIQFNIFKDILEKQNKENLISYLGTHDNETIKEFVKKLSYDKKSQIRHYFKSLGINSLFLVDGFVDYLFKHEKAIISFVDLLKMSNKYRINEPSTIKLNNWSSKIYNFDKLEKALKKVNKKCTK